ALPSISRVPRAPFTKTATPAYAPASLPSRSPAKAAASILFPAFERRDSSRLRRAKEMTALQHELGEREKTASSDSQGATVLRFFLYENHVASPRDRRTDSRCARDGRNKPAIMDQKPTGTAGRGHMAWSGASPFVA